MLGPMTGREEQQTAPEVLQTCPGLLNLSPDLPIPIRIMSPWQLISIWTVTESLIPGHGFGLITRTGWM